jgi:hypothetical protein
MLLSHIINDYNWFYKGIELYRKEIAQQSILIVEDLSLKNNELLVVYFLFILSYYFDEMILTNERKLIIGLLVSLSLTFN